MVYSEPPTNIVSPLILLHYKGQAHKVGSIYSIAKQGLLSRVWIWIQRHFRAKLSKLESDSSDRVQSERLEDIQGAFKYHGFLKHTFQQTFSPGQEEQLMFWFKDKFPNQATGSLIPVSKALVSKAFVDTRRHTARVSVEPWSRVKNSSHFLKTCPLVSETHEAQ